MPTTAPLNGQYEIATYRNNTTVPLVQHILVVSGRLNVPGHIPFPFPPYPYWATLAAAVRTVAGVVGTAIAVVVAVVPVLAIPASAVLDHSTLVHVLAPVRTSVLGPFAAGPDSSVGTG
jgi:hypothetical protein